MSSDLQAPARNEPRVLFTTSGHFRSSPKYNFGRLAVLVAIFSGTLASRIAIFSSTPTEWDSVQFVFGSQHFDLREDSPHPPGYWLYVELGRLTHWLLPISRTASLSLISAIFSAIAATLAWRIGEKLGRRSISLALTALVIALPLNWFYGSIPAVYTFDLFACLFFANIALKESVTHRDVLIAAVALGLLTGTRQSALSIFGPVVLFILVRSRPAPKSIAVSLLAGLAALSAWIIPAALDQTGGIATLYQQSRDMWQNAANQTSWFSNAPAAAVRYNIARATAAPIVSILFALPIFALLAIARVLPIFRDRAGNNERRTIWVAVLLALPGFLVTTLGYYGKPGYILAYFPGLLLLGCIPLIRLRRSLRITGCALLCVVAGVWSIQFLDRDGILLPRLLNHQLWFTQDKYGAPYRDNTREGMQRINADTAQYKPLTAAVRPTDTLVFEGQEGVWRFRQENWAHNNLVQELVNIAPGDPYCIMTVNGSKADCPNTMVEVQPGGRAVFVANAPTNAVKALANTGKATRIELPTGPTAFAIEPGQTVGNLRVVVNPQLIPGIESDAQKVE